MTNINDQNTTSRIFTQGTLLNRMTHRIRQSLELDEILSTTVAEVRAFLQTDRIKIYRFDQDATGEVIAESVDHKRLPSLLGLHFPAGDIPPQIREMYVKARQRSIVNVATQQMILSRLDSSETSLALTVEEVQQTPIQDILTRPVDPCHLQYLQTMGVQSSLVVPIIDHVQAWGLLISHHAQPKDFSEEDLQIVQMVADQVSIAIAQSNLLNQTRARASREALINQISTLLHAPLTIKKILQGVLKKVVNAVDGAGGRLYLVPVENNTSAELYTYGIQPDLQANKDNLTLLEDWPYWQNLIRYSGELEGADNFYLADNNPWENYQISDDRSQIFYHQTGTQIQVINDIYQNPQLESIAFAFRVTPLRSLIAMPLKYSQHSFGCLTIFHSEINTDIIWAGRFDPDERQQRVRQSFQAWQELKFGQARPWTLDEIELVQAIGTHLSMAVMQNRLYQWEREHRMLIEMRNQELNLARSAAQEASRLKSDFLSSTSHELRTPLTSTINYLKLLKEKFYDNEEELAEYINIAYQSAEHLVAILNDILDIAKIEAGPMMVNIELIEIKPFLENQCQLFNLESRRKGINLKIECEVERVWADEIKLTQILLNLLANAFKFTSQGSVRLRVIQRPISPESPEKLVVEISITDTGIGIDPDQKDKLFEAFVQGDGSIKRRYGGTGLGLTICKRLIELMGGRIWLDSPGKNQGTTVTFTLPCQDHQENLEFSSKFA